MATDARCLFVTGAARSGTHLLATIVHEATGCTYLGEINDFWRSLTPAVHHDMIPATLARPELAERFYRRFRPPGPVEGPACHILDKTAANSLRLPFLYRLFPDARFMHIIRDGRDVAVSVRRKYEGDTRKITKVASASPAAGRGVKDGWANLGHKLRTGLSPRRVLSEPGRYWAGGLRMLGIRAQHPWGPAAPGLRDMIRSHCVLEVAAYQWRCSVENALAFHEAYPEASYIEVRYEQLVADPAATLEPVWDWLGVRFDTGKLCTEVVGGGQTYDQVLTDDEQARIRAIAGWTLARLGYR